MRKVSSSRGFVAVVTAALLIVIVSSCSPAASDRETKPSTKVDRCKQATSDAAEFDFFGSGKLLVAVIGDSYSLGTGAGIPKEDAWPIVMSKILGVRVAILGEGRTGYLNGGYCGTSRYAGRVSRAVGMSPDVVVVAGGINDVGLGDLTGAAFEVLQGLKEVNHLVVGPVVVPSVDAVGTSAIDLSLRLVASVHGSFFASALGWPIELTEDGLHPTSEGYADYASRVSALLQPRLMLTDR
ncbi:SGNH/GDSL hydrolase family protein [Gordonia rubripertincta]|uniref:SGNH/GDSL hydrolase family protein n=1 Tax=Gordonia rubripertincta TaxID=36822 RepID=UPI0026B8C0CB